MLLQVRQEVVEVVVVVVQVHLKKRNLKVGNLVNIK